MTRRYSFHGHASSTGKSRTYRIWQYMHRRCSDADDPKFKYYGGRGITVCARWADFTAFLADMGESPTGLTLERKNNDGHYEPGNCRWASRSEQQRNSRNAKFITFNGECLCVREWEQRLGLTHGALFHRLKRGWSIERAMTARRMEP